MVKDRRKIGYAVPPCGDNKKRTITKYFSQGKKVFTPLEIINFVDNFKNNYSPYTDPSRLLFLESRDKALISLLSITCCRLNESLRIRKSQMDYSRLDFLIIRNFRVSKRKKDPKTGEPKKQFIKEMPMTIKEGALLYPFTKNIIEHSKEIGDRSLLFKIGVRRARQIITALDPDIFPHFLRGCMLTYYLNLLKNPYLVAKMFGIVDVRTLRFYYGGEWEDHTEALSR